MKPRLPLIIVAVLATTLGLPPQYTIAQDKTVATVDGAPITEADLRFASLEIGASRGDLSPADRRRIAVEVVIQRQILAAAAEQASLQANQDFEQRLAYTRRTLLQQLFIEKRVREAVTEADARRIYDEQSALQLPEEEVRVRHVLVDSEAKAEELHASLVKGADFATLAKAQSTDARSARQGGDLGWRTKSEMPKLAAAAFALQKPGDLSPPIKTTAGWHIILLEARRMRSVPAFGAMKDDIIRILIRNKARELAKDLRQKAKIVYIDPDLEPKAPTEGALAVPEAPQPAPSAAPR